MSSKDSKLRRSKKKTSPRRRRASSVGRIDVGDTVHGLGTMHESLESRHASIERLKMLTEDSDKDIDLLRKFWLSFQEMNHRHTWIAPLLILAVVYASYFTSGNLSASNPLHKFVAVSYQVGDTDMYGKGINDLCFVFFYMIFFTFLREFLLDVVIRPLPARLNVTSSHKSKRIMEQAYSIFYYGISSPFGIYIMYHSDLWLFRTDTMYRTYPDLNLPFLFKVFYLGQAAFWAQQACILVLQIEKPRKDYKELMYHHIVTMLLIWSSYVFHFHKMGLAVYISMDVSDFLLSLSKILNYMDSPLTLPTFVIFVVTWCYLRHYVNARILWSVLTEFRTEGNYVLNYATQQYKCWISLPIVFTLIAALQLVNLYWLFLIFRILYRAIWQGVEKDTRSDNESDDDSSSSSGSSSTSSVSGTDTKKEN